MLERPGAEDEHPPEVCAVHGNGSTASSKSDRRRLLANIMAGLPGAFDRYDIPGLRRMLERYNGMTREALRENLARFLREVIPTAEEAGIRMCIHPDDPPRPPLGLPRIVGSADDLAFIVERLRRRTPTASRSAPARWVPASITTCRPWRSASPGRSSSPICATSPRSRTAPSWKPTTWAATSTWFPVVTTLLEEQKRRRDAGDPDWRIPFRPDHGHELLDDVGKATFPGYPAIGRLRGWPRSAES